MKDITSWPAWQGKNTWCGWVSSGPTRVLSLQQPPPRSYTAKSPNCQPTFGFQSHFDDPCRKGRQCNSKFLDCPKEVWLKTWWTIELVFLGEVIYLQLLVMKWSFLREKYLRGLFHSKQGSTWPYSSENTSKAPSDWERLVTLVVLLVRKKLNGASLIRWNNH